MCGPTWSICSSSLFPFYDRFAWPDCFRLLRLLRVATVLTEVLRRARSILTHKGLHYVVLSAMVIVFAAAGLEYHFEAGAAGSNIHDFGDALWWAVVTVTTVGYGDRFPVTPGGRGVAVVLMLVGIGLVGTVTATVASYFIEQRDDGITADLDRRLDRIEQLLEVLTSRVAWRGQRQPGFGCGPRRAGRRGQGGAQRLTPRRTRIIVVPG